MRKVCKKCNTSYTVTIHELPVRDKDEAHCHVCGELLKKWNESRYYSFKKDN